MRDRHPDPWATTERVRCRVMALGAFCGGVALVLLWTL